MEKKLFALLAAALAFADASAAVIVQNTTTQTTVAETSAPAAQTADAAPGGGISIRTYEADEPPMSIGEAAWALSRATAIVSMDIASDTTVSEQAFAMASLLYKSDQSEAENALKELFYTAPSNEARVYALMGIYAFGKIADFNELLKSINTSEKIAAVVGGKPYSVSIEKFFSTFKNDPSLFVPSGFPPKNLTFAPPPATETATTTTTTTTTTYSNVAFSVWSPAVYMPDLIFWNPFYRPVIVFHHHHRPPHIRPPAPRPIPPRPRPPHAKPDAKQPSHGKDAPAVRYSPARPKVGSSAKGVKNRQPSSASLTKLDLDAKVYKAPKKTQPSSSAPKAAPKPEAKTQPPAKASPKPQSAAPKTTAPKTPAPRAAAPQTQTSAPRTTSPRAQTSAPRSASTTRVSAPKAAPAPRSAPAASAKRR